MNLLIIPAYEPDERLLKLLGQLRAVSDIPVIVVDDGSQDSKNEIYNRIFEVAEKTYGCILLKHAVNLGKGRALKTAFNFCLCHYPNFKYLITADSDGQHTVSSIMKMLKVADESKEELILGVRDFSGNHIPLKSAFGNKLTTFVMKSFCGLSVSDTQTGLRGIPREFVKLLMNVKGERFEYETRMLLSSKELSLNGRGFHIREVPIETIYESKTNHQTHFDPIKDSLRIYGIFFESFGKFLFSSFLSFLLDIGLFYFFYNKLGGGAYSIAYATVGARIISATFNYMVNHKIVFASTVSHKQAYYQYWVLAFFIMCSSALLVTIIKSFLPSVSATLIKVCVDSLLFYVSFKVQRERIFSRNKKPSGGGVN